MPASVTRAWMAETGQINAGLMWPILEESATAMTRRDRRIMVWAKVASSGSSVVRPRWGSKPLTLRKARSR